MKRLESDYVTTPPERRPLRIYASDPMTPGGRITVKIRNEELLEPGPVGEKVEVVDYDGEQDCFYEPVNLDDPAILMQGGLEPNESDPRFHQQMVYAVAMKTIENFERALGRQIAFRRRGKERLRIYPHAFHGANAFFDPNLNALLFGYFRADENDPGRNLPGQNVFTCLSHDIIAHEMTHAVVHRLRRRFLDPTNQDVLAFHEGFSDIVALFQHFSFEEMLRRQISIQRTRIDESTMMVELAQQFGYATGQGRALRSAIGHQEQRLDPEVIEPHARGSILVAAVFDAFFTVYRRRIEDLIRIATAGTGNLPDADLHPDLVNRVAVEASEAAQSILTMCIRAFDYLPPVDITFGDFLRALVTADYELLPEDRYGQREAMIEAFRRRGIYPENVASLAEESLIWRFEGDRPPRFPATLLGHLATAAGSLGRRRESRVERGGAASYAAQYKVTIESDYPGTDRRREIALQAHAYAEKNARVLGLDPDRKIAVEGFHPVFRVAPDGQLLIELVVQYTQHDDSQKKNLGGLSLRGGTTLVVGADGTVRYAIRKPLKSSKLSPGHNAAAEARLARQVRYMEMCDERDPRTQWGDKAYLSKRMELRARFSSLCDGL